MPEHKGPSTAPPPFDPEEYARESDAAIAAASDFKVTTKRIVAPPLNKKVRLAVPESDLDWFELSDVARAFLRQFDGTKTLLELMEGNPSPDLLRVVAQLHDARVFAYED